MMPITQEHASVTALFPGNTNGPFDETFTILVVQETVALEAKVYVCEHQGLAE